MCVLCVCNRMTVSLIPVVLIGSVCLICLIGMIGLHNFNNQPN